MTKQKIDEKTMTNGKTRIQERRTTKNSDDGHNAKILK